MSYTYEYPRPAVSVDMVVFLKKENALEVLLIRRGNEPYKGMHAFPGGFVDMDETVETAARRELMEECHIDCARLSQFKAYSAIDRDPRQRTIGIVFYYVSENVAEFAGFKAGDDAADAEFINVKDIGDLAFDHNVVLNDLLEYIGYEK